MPGTSSAPSTASDRLEGLTWLPSASSELVARRCRNGGGESADPPQRPWLSSDVILEMGEIMHDLSRRGFLASLGKLAIGAAPVAVFPAGALELLDRFFWRRTKTFSVPKPSLIGLEGMIRQYGEFPHITPYLDDDGYIQILPGTPLSPGSFAEFQRMISFGSGGRPGDNT